MAAEIDSKKETPFPPIQQRLMQFIRREFRPGFNHYNVSKLVGDASARQYYRFVVEDPGGRSYILAAYPEPFDARKFPYKEVYDLLRKIGVAVPEILGMDGDLGIVLQEDLGNESLQRRLINVGPEERRRLLAEAMDVIACLQTDGSPLVTADMEAGVLAFDEEKLMWEFNFFLRYYIAKYRQKEPSGGNTLQEEFLAISRELAAAPRVLCHRDFHVRNLMLKQERLFVIDFQDARWGPAVYDPVSLLKDSLELSGEEIEEQISHFHNRRSGLDEAAFNRQFHLMTVQRLLKALGTFGYQAVVRENFIYEQYMAGSLHRALLSLEELDAFPAARKLIEEEFRAKSKSD